MTTRALNEKERDAPDDADAPVRITPSPCEPIDWTPQKERLFLSGGALFGMMTRDEFERTYPSAGGERE